MAKKLDYDYEKAQEMFTNGIALSQIAKTLNIPINTLKSKKHREKWQKDASSSKKKVQKDASSKKRETFINPNKKDASPQKKGCIRCRYYPRNIV